MKTNVKSPTAHSPRVSRIPYPAGAVEQARILPRGILNLLEENAEPPLEARNPQMSTEEASRPFHPTTFSNSITSLRSPSSLRSGTAWRMSIASTNAALISVAINPYEWRRSYSANVMAKYRNPTGYDAPLPPHLYQTAQMVDSAATSEAGVQQSIIISGESGASKTESLKIISLTSLVHRIAPTPCRAAHLSGCVLRANPLLEAFGNAGQTTRNNNCRALVSSSSSIGLRSRPWHRKRHDEVRWRSPHR